MMGRHQQSSETVYGVQGTPLYVPSTQSRLEERVESEAGGYHVPTAMLSQPASQPRSNHETVQRPGEMFLVHHNNLPQGRTVPLNIS